MLILAHLNWDSQEIDMEKSLPKNPLPNFSNFWSDCSACSLFGLLAQTELFGLLGVRTVRSVRHFFLFAGWSVREKFDWPLFKTSCFRSMFILLKLNFCHQHLRKIVTSITLSPTVREKIPWIFKTQFNYSIVTLQPIINPHFKKSEFSFDKYSYHGWSWMIDFCFSCDSQLVNIKTC